MTNINQTIEYIFNRNGIKITIEDVFDAILKKKINSSASFNSIEVDLSDALSYFRDPYLPCGAKREKYVIDNYDSLWGNDMIGDFCSEEDESITELELKIYNLNKSKVDISVNDIII